jgi:hypothetical protein
MKLSPETITVLKNFATINHAIQFKSGNKLSTVSPGKTVLAQAVLKDSFPEDFCIYDLNQFLSVYSINKNPEINFDINDVVFNSGRSKIRYRKTQKEMIVIPPEKEIKLASVDCSFTFTDEDYASVLKTANILSSPNISVFSDGETIQISTFDASDDSAHTNTLDVGEGNGKKYKIIFKTENIKMIPGTYKVEISFKGIGHFKNTKEDIQYWIAFESKGTEY